MKRIATLMLIVFFTLSNSAQEKQDKKEENPIDSTAVTSVDKIIKSLYNVISGEAGKKRNWEQFKFLFKKDAKLIAAGKDSEGENNIVYMKPEDYIKNSGKWLEANGFFEREIYRTTNRFGSMVQVFSTYQCFYNVTDKKPFMRGINSIQLWNDGKRWWIINLYWTQETKNNPIPDIYLPIKEQTP